VFVCVCVHVYMCVCVCVCVCVFESYLKVIFWNINKQQRNTLKNDVSKVELRVSVTNGRRGFKVTATSTLLQLPGLDSPQDTGGRMWNKVVYCTVCS